MEVSLVPPNVELLWHPPATPDKWFFVYLVEWLNETSVVEDSEGTQAILSSLEAAQQYNVTITAYTDSTLCPQQSASFNFTTTQSEYSCATIIPACMVMHHTNVVFTHANAFDNAFYVLADSSTRFYA